MAESENLGKSRTGGRSASEGLIEGKYALCVGMPTNRLSPRGWEWTSLSQIAQLESGHTPSRKQPEYWDGDIPWVGIKDAVDNHGRTVEDTYQHVSPLGLANSSARLLPKNTVCLSRTASVGFVVVMGRPMSTSQDFVNWVCGPRILPDFLKYILISENEALWRFASGTTHQTIYYPEAKAFHICLPPLAEQEKIVSLLKGLDDKIELNRRMNETLEAIARTIFKSWFVDFDPVKAKAAGKKPFGMDDETAALFPNEFEDSELGPIPKGWRVGTFSEICTVLSGTTPSTSIQEFWHPPEHAWSSPKDLSNIEGLFLLHTERKISSAGLAQIGSGLLPKGSVLLSTRAPIGYVAIANIPVAINQGYAGLVVHDSGSRFYVENWIRSNHEILVSNANGSTFLEISKGTLKLLPCLKPSLQVLRAFGNLLEPFYDALLGNQAQSKTLAQTRDLLLPKLLSGELELREFEKKLGFLDEQN